MNVTNKFESNQPNLTWESTHSWLETVLWRASHFHLAIWRCITILYHYRPTVSTVSRDHFHMCVMIRSSSQYWFWRGCVVFLVTSDYHFAQAVLYNVVPLVGVVSYFPPTQGRPHSQSRPKHTIKLSHLHVLWAGSLTRNTVQHTAVLQLLFDFAYVPKGCYGLHSSVYNKCATAWNSLSNEKRNIPTLERFKANRKRYLLSLWTAYV